MQYNIYKMEAIWFKSIEKVIQSEKNKTDMLTALLSKFSEINKNKNTFMKHKHFIILLYLVKFSFNYMIQLNKTYWSK